VSRRSRTRETLLGLAGSLAHARPLTQVDLIEALTAADEGMRRRG